MKTETTYTVVAWQSGESRVSAVGATSMDPDLLRPTLDYARERFGEERAEIVPFAFREAKVTTVQMYAADKRAEQAAINAAMDKMGA